MMVHRCKVVCSSTLLLVVGCLTSIPTLHGFGSILPTRITRDGVRLDASTTSEISTLTASTTWKARLVLQNKGKEPTMISFAGQFIGEDGYEPPQGTFRITDEDAPVRVKSSRWMLSEDPEDRRDGLWIWGLFRFENCFKFLLLNLELEDVENEGSITRFYAQIPHENSDGNVKLDTATLAVQKMEQYDADPLGFAKVEIADRVDVGRISFFPVSEQKAVS